MFSRIIMKSMLLACVVLLSVAADSNAQLFGRRNQNVTPAPAAPVTYPANGVITPGTVVPAATQGPVAAKTEENCCGGGTGPINNPDKCYPLVLVPGHPCECGVPYAGKCVNPFSSTLVPGTPLDADGPATPLAMYTGYVAFQSKVDVPACRKAKTLVPDLTYLTINWNCCPPAAAGGGPAAAACGVKVCVYNTPLCADIKDCTLAPTNANLQARIRRCKSKNGEVLVDIVAIGVPQMPQNWILAFGIKQADATTQFGVTFGSITKLGDNENPPN
jgi:hypothetical protein